MEYVNYGRPLKTLIVISKKTNKIWVVVAVKKTKKRSWKHCFLTETPQTLILALIGKEMREVFFSFLLSHSPLMRRTNKKFMTASRKNLKHFFLLIRRKHISNFTSAVKLLGEMRWNGFHALPFVYFSFTLS